jgi:hypothetical protein
MTIPARYKASWVPGLQHDIDRDESLRVGLNWLIEAEQEQQARGVIVMYAKKMAQNAPLLSRAAERWEFVSPRSRRNFSGTGPVLAIWPPNGEVLELAEMLALDSSLCVIAGFKFDISPWVKKANAVCLVPGYEGELTELALASDARKLLDGMLSSDGHNGFVGGGGKEDSIRTLHAIAAMPDRPTPQAIRGYLMASGETDADGAERARRWYEEILAGKRHRDYRGRII